MGEIIGKFSYLDYLEEKTLASGRQINIDYSVNLREKTGDGP